MPRYKALLTDLDGTLIHSQDCICDALAEAFEKVSGGRPAKEDIMDMFGLPVEVMLTTLTDVSPDDHGTIEEFTGLYNKS